MEARSNLSGMLYGNEGTHNYGDMTQFPSRPLYWGTRAGANTLGKL